MFGFGSRKVLSKSIEVTETMELTTGTPISTAMGLNSTTTLSNVTQAQRPPGFQSVVGCTALVTGSSGMCGARLVEMLLERGAQLVIAFDRATPDAVLQQRFERATGKAAAAAAAARDGGDGNEYGGKIHVCAGTMGDLTNPEAVEKAFQAANRIDMVFHLAALVGPYFKKQKYHDVNYLGTMRILDMCRKYKVSKLIFAGSPSTRMTGKDIRGQTEDELPYPEKWLELYAETKAKAEMEVFKACTDTLLTISVAPHQVYGPHDSLMLPAVLEAAGNGNLRIFGKGLSKVSFCYSDNYSHGLMCGADALYKDSPALAKLYIITDDEPQLFWTGFINRFVVAMGFTDLTHKWSVPVWLLYLAAVVAECIGYLTGRPMKLNRFVVTVLLMDRYFSIARAKRDLRYHPIVPYEQAAEITIQWFRENWLPKFHSKTGNIGNSHIKGD